MENGNGQAPAPKISGFSTPVGSSTARKQESPAQRSEKINQQNIEKPKIQTRQTKATVLQERPVTQEEVDTFRKKRTRKRSILAILIAVFLLAGGATAWIILSRNKQSNYSKNASIYNDNYPIVVKDNNYFLISQTGKKLTDDYEYIESYKTDTTLAYKENKYYILDTTGKPVYETENLVTQSEDTNNYLVVEDGKSYILDLNGKKISDSYFIDNAQGQRTKYSLVRNEINYQIIDENGKEKLKKVIDHQEPIGFSFAENIYEDKYYCAIQLSNENSYDTEIYNCDTGKLVKKLENTRASFGETSSLTADYNQTETYYYVYADDILFESDKPSYEIFAGIIETQGDNGETLYFDPKDKSLSENYPVHSLIPQSKLDKTTDITDNCFTYKKYPEQNITQICNSIYIGNKKANLIDNNYSYDLLPKELSVYLKYLGKNYILREPTGSNTYSIYDLDKSKVIENLSSLISYDIDNKSSFVYASIKDGMVNYYNLITDKTVQVSTTSIVKMGENYLAIDDGEQITYYNKEAKEIYKITKGE